MPIEVALIAIVVLLAALLAVRRYNERSEAADEKAGPKTEKRPAASNSRSKVAHKSTPYHAVSIKFASNACATAKEMEGKRFLSGAAPRLPLPECDVLECKCRFVHHADRRTGDDRRSTFPRGFGTADTGSYEQERRKRAGERRTGDDADDFF